MDRSTKALALTLIYILVVAFQPKALATIRPGENKPKDSEVEKRRLVICLDGTWNSPHDEKKTDDGRQLLFKPTNVLKTCRSVRPIGDDGVVQLVYYASGVGSAARFPGPANTVYAYTDKYLGGVWGAGFESNVASALTYLAMNYRKGDEVFLFGFSRGAATARGVTQFLRWAGGAPKREDAYWLPFLFRSFIDHDGKDIPAEDDGIGTDSQDASLTTFDSRNMPQLLSEADTQKGGTFGCDNMVVPKSPHRNVQRFDEARCKQLKTICESIGNKGHRPKSCEGGINKIDMVDVPINFLGVWDTVMALGSRFEATGATTTPSPSRSFYVADQPAPAVEVARQALAIDERRYDFRPEIWTSHWSGQDMKQRWFPGVHSNVGGGYIHDGLANGAFQWILGEAQRFGLKVDTDFASHYHPYPQDCLYETYTFGAELIDIVRGRRDEGIRSLRKYDSSRYPGANLELDGSVCERLAYDPSNPNDKEAHGSTMGDKRYQPNNLLKYLGVEEPIPTPAEISSYCRVSFASHSGGEHYSEGLFGVIPYAAAEDDHDHVGDCRQ